MTFNQFLIRFAENWRSQTTTPAEMIEFEQQLISQRYRRTVTPQRHRLLDYGFDVVSTHSHHHFDVFWRECCAAMPFLEGDLRHAYLAKS